MERFDLLLNNFDTLSKELKIVSTQLKQENDEFFNAIVENSTNFIAIVQNGKYVFMNSAGLNLFQAKSSTDIIGRNIKETVNQEGYRLILNHSLKESKSSENRVCIKYSRIDNTSLYLKCNIASFLFNKQPAILITGNDITKEIKQQSRLQSEEKLRTDILNAFQEIIAFYGPDHRFLWLNDAGKKQLNIQDDSYIGNLCYKMWFNSDKPCKTCPVVTRKIESQERIVTFEDRTIWMIRNTPLFDNKGILTGYIEFRTNITEKENIKIELEKSHARQLRAEQINLFGHFEIDLGTNHFVLSPGSTNILGLSQKNDTNYSVDFFKYLHPDDVWETRKYLELAYSGKKKFDRIFKIYDANCVEKTIRGIGEVKGNAASGFRKFFAVVQDITRISNLEKQIFDEREKYKMLAENAPFGLLLTKDNKPVYINKTLAEWFGLESLSDFKNSGFANFFHPNDKKTAKLISKKIEENNVPAPLIEKLRFVKKDGSLLHIRLDLKNSIIQDQNYVQIVITDITDDVINEKKKKQIAADSLYINQKNSILSEIEIVLTKTLSLKKFSKSRHNFEEIYNIINNYKQLDKDWKMLITNFEEVHPGFFTRLKKNYPTLSPIDIKHCACIKMNMDTKEIARFFNIKVTSVQIGRVRIKKKMSLPDTIDLRSHILNF